LHGFIVRWPMKGYVVGPGSRINGRMYSSVGTEDIATLPVEWAEGDRGTSTENSKPLITVTDDSPGYTLPDSVPVGGRHDAIASFVASRWNRGLSFDEVAVAVRGVLAPRFAEVMDDRRLDDEIRHAWDTCEKGGWQKTFGDTGDDSVSPRITDEATGEEVVIDPLAIEARTSTVAPIDFAGTLPTGLAMLLDHFTPLTDAPYSSLALTSCVVMSALAGTAPSLMWRGSHRAALFGALVGHSGYGRKGATMREVEQAFRQVDPLLDEIMVGGIASGEVLVDILNESKNGTLGTSLIWEHEIANILILATREGNIMSGNLRKAWDGDKVESRSRAKGKSTATGYNVAFMGGVTPAELEKRLSGDDIANGWANRFLWFHSERRPGGFNATADPTMAAPLVSYLRDCISFARSLGGSYLIKPLATMSFTPLALARMEALTLALDVPPVGVIGAMRQRMPAHVTRLAMVAALFDQTAEVDEVHVAFGEVMAQYAVESMRPAFGLRVDDPVALLAYGVLRQSPDGWMNTSTLRAAVGGKDHSRVRSALDVLINAGLVVREDRKATGSSGGRPSVGYRLSFTQERGV
jgi:predicted transcriptional regulator